MALLRSVAVPVPPPLPPPPPPPPKDEAPPRYRPPLPPSVSKPEPEPGATDCFSYYTRVRVTDACGNTYWAWRPLGGRVLIPWECVVNTYAPFCYLE
jgi:hypothetical protein